MAVVLAFEKHHKDKHMNTNCMQDKPVPWHHRILKDCPQSDPQYWPDSLRLKYVTEELEEYRLAFPNPLAEPVQPVAWMSSSALISFQIDRERYPLGGGGNLSTARYAKSDHHNTPLYTTPPAAQPADKSRMDIADAIKSLCANGELPDSFEDVADWIAKGAMPTAQPAQRQPLTDEQIDKLWMQNIPSGMNGTEWRRGFVRAIEQALAAQPAPSLTRSELRGLWLSRQAHMDGWDFYVAIDARLFGSAAAQPAVREIDPCPGCRKGGVCRTPECGRLKLPREHPYRTGLPAQPAPQPAQQEPTIAACIIGADAVDKNIDGYEAAKVYVAMQKAMGTPPTPCTWTQSRDPSMPDTFDATCGVVWTFNDGGPAENGMRFCPGCGSKVTKGGSS
jgi:hypothetical protein